MVKMFTPSAYALHTIVACAIEPDATNPKGAWDDHWEPLKLAILCFWAPDAASIVSGKSDTSPVARPPLVPAF